MGFHGKDDVWELENSAKAQLCDQIALLRLRHVTRTEREPMKGLYSCLPAGAKSTHVSQVPLAVKICSRF